MSSLLTQHEQQYASLVAEITIQIGQLNAIYDDSHDPLEDHQVKTISDKIDSSLLEAHELLEQMNLEIHDLEVVVHRTNASSRLNCALVELQRLQAEYQRIKGLRSKDRSIHQETEMMTRIPLSSQGRNPLTDRVDSSVYLYGEEQKQRLLENAERIEGAGNRLQQGYRVILETEALGTQVLNDLYQQRETIQGARGRLRETNADLGRASRTLNAMIFRIWREKFILYGVIVCFVLAVVISLYLTLSPSSTQPTKT